MTADCLVRLAGFARLKQVLSRPVTSRTPTDDAHQLAVAAHQIVGLASTWYVDAAQCLQRTVAVSLLLRARGIPSVIVLGVKTMPYEGHAWLEIDGHVIGEDGWRLQHYVELERITVAA